MIMSSDETYVLPRVLHVDPDHDAAVVLATLLVPDTEVVHVATLAAAQAHLAAHEFALVVLDPRLPDGDGHHLVQHLRARSQHTPVLLYSASQPVPHHQAHAFLPKPWTSPSQLWRTVALLLGIDPLVPPALQAMAPPLQPLEP
ncbi:response regulator [Pseudoduganella sp. RAF53_2]|uniref:response regulator n=1 Tax=unclassified Pseudoduganella TaxID=2637179 RepID=UPI003F9D3ADD